MSRKNKKSAAIVIETSQLESAIEIEMSAGENSETVDTTETQGDISIEASIFETEEMESDGFIPEVTEESLLAETNTTENSEIHEAVQLEGTELDGFESAQIEEVEFVEDEKIESIVESILFASDRPVSFASIQQVFKGTNVRKDKIRRALDAIAVEYAGGRRGVTLEEVTGGYQIRTKMDNLTFLKRTLKTRPFKLSGPALETLSIVAYKQPVVKIEIDQIRGVESGHLLRALMEKGLVNFEGKAESLPGKPMQYGTTRRFLEIFGLRNLKELPSLSQIDELLPEGIGEEAEEKPTLSMVTDSMSEEVKTVSYSQGEEELGVIENELSAISTSSDFFEQEKLRQRKKRDEERAQNIRDALLVGEEVSKRDQNWLKKFDEAIAAGTTLVEMADKPSETEMTAAVSEEAQTNKDDLTDALAVTEVHHLNFEETDDSESSRFETDSDENSDEETHLADIEGEDEAGRV